MSQGSRMGSVISVLPVGRKAVLARTLVIMAMTWPSTLWASDAAGAPAAHPEYMDLPRLRLTTEFRNAMDVVAPRHAEQLPPDYMKQHQETPTPLQLNEELGEISSEKSVAWRFVPPPGQLNRSGISRATGIRIENGVTVLEGMDGYAQTD